MPKVLKKKLLPFSGVPPGKSGVVEIQNLFIYSEMHIELAMMKYLEVQYVQKSPEIQVIITSAESILCDMIH